VDQRVPELEHVTHLPVNTRKRAAIQAPVEFYLDGLVEKNDDIPFVRNATRD